MYSLNQITWVYHFGQNKKQYCKCPTPPRQIKKWAVPIKISGVGGWWGITVLHTSLIVLFFTRISTVVLFWPFIDLCSLDNGDCSHNCTVAPGEGVICSCPLGMELGPNNKTCQIQSFCAKHLMCSQRCEQDKFSVKCSCYEGWELEPDMENCKSTGERRRKRRRKRGWGGWGRKVRRHQKKRVLDWWRPYMENGCQSGDWVLGF